MLIRGCNLLRLANDGYENHWSLIGGGRVVNLKIEMS
jgi:hypothetical protein